MNNYSEFQVNIFSKNSHIRLHLEILSQKRGITLSKKWRITSPTGMGSPFDGENYSEFQVNISSNNRDIRVHLEKFYVEKGA